MPKFIHIELSLLNKPLIVAIKMPKSYLKIPKS